MKDYYKELRKEVRTNKKQLQKIETKKQMLEYMKRYMSKEEYEEELRKIEIESNHIYQSIALANEKLSTPKVTENYFNTIEKLVKLYQETNDVDFKKVISDVINEKRNEVIRLNEQLPEELQGGLDDLYGSVVIKDDSELSKISKSKEIFESIKRDNYKKQAKIVRMIGTTYNSNSETDQQLREKYVEELRDAKEEIAILDKYLSRMNKEYN
ncbi:MAG: hypothetical protein IJ193_07810, partial [Bacilli bacterium]|nr:hypothetical protein [Bacilli bacterium]